jgi:hypothetical protein
MTDKQALEILRTRGYATGTPDTRSGKVRVWSNQGGLAVDVAMGRELEDLAVGRLSLDEISDRREDEVLAET